MNELGVVSEELGEVEQELLFDVENEESAVFTVPSETEKTEPPIKTERDELERQYNMVDKMEDYIEKLMSDKMISKDPVKQMRLVMQASVELRRLIDSITKLENEKMKSGAMSNSNEKFVLTELTININSPDGTTEIVTV